MYNPPGRTPEEQALFDSISWPGQSENGTSICLNMICKNESHIIVRCLDSVVPYIDSFVIMDTGSTDGTPDIIREYFKERGIPGMVYERPFVNFGYSRTEALYLAHGVSDFIFLVDCDMVLNPPSNKKWKNTLKHEHGAYMLEQHYAGSPSTYWNIRLVSDRREGDDRWTYWCPTHEYIAPISDASKPYPRFKLEGVSFVEYLDGGSKSDKFERDLRLLSAEYEDLKPFKRLYKARKEGPLSDTEEAEYQRLKVKAHTFPRIVYLLAKTYSGLKDWENSLKFFKLRMKMPGFSEEAWVCGFQALLIEKELKYPAKDIVELALHIYQMRPQRIEPLYVLAQHYRESGERALQYLFAKAMMGKPLPKDEVLFIDRELYTWKRMDEYATAAFYAGETQESLKLFKLLAKMPEIKGNAVELARIDDNIRKIQQATKGTK